MKEFKKIKSCLNCEERKHGCYELQKRDELGNNSVYPCLKWKLNISICENCQIYIHCNIRIKNLPSIILGCTIKKDIKNKEIFISNYAIRK